MLIDDFLDRIFYAEASCIEKLISEAGWLLTGKKPTN